MAKKHEKPEHGHMQKPAEEEGFQKKYLEYNIYKNQLQGFSEELEAIAATVHALNTARETLESFEKLKENPDILVPIGAQTFAHAKITDLKKVLVNIGAGTVLKKDVPKALETINAQAKELEEAQTKIEVNINGLADKMNNIEVELEDYAQKSGKKGGEEK